MEHKSIRSRIMDYVQANGPMRRTKIIEFIINNIQTHRGPYQPTRDRGYYCDHFYGSYPYFCTPLKSDKRFLMKNEKGEYFVESA